MKTSVLSRREFIRLSGMTGAVLALGYYLPSAGKEAAVLAIDTAEDLGIELNAFIFIDSSGKITILNHRSEMGQGSFQVVPQMIAEELEVNLNDINIVFAPGSQTKYGSQLTGGSSTVRRAYKHLMRVGATAREMLIEAAARKWNVNKAECYAENAFVIHRPSGRKLSYGELAADASRLTPPKDVKLKSRSEYKIIGKPLPRQDTPLKVNGKAAFGLDKKIPGMLYAAVERNPRFLGKVKSYDDSAARKIQGVKQVMKVQMDVFSHKREGVAVIADTLWAALEGKKALRVEWDDNGFPHHSTEQLFKSMHESLSQPGLTQRAAGNFETYFNKASSKLEAVYETPYQAHACLEPLTCTAHHKGDSCEIWGPIQAPDWIQSDIAMKFNLKPENVTVHMTFLGGGFGRKAFTDYTYEAVAISKAVNAPVQVVWTREDDMTQGPFRPGNVYQCRAGLSAQGRITAFEVKMAAQNLNHQWPGADPDSYNDSTTEGFLEPYFEAIPHYRFADIPLASPVPVMWWRSVYSSTNAFAFESFLDELAMASGKDPLQFRKEHLPHERHQLLIEKLEEVSGWKQRGKNTGYGVAVTECFRSIVGEVVKVSRKADGKIKIDKVWAVIDCGWYVNPDIIRAQVEGSIVMALGAATKHAMEFSEGKAALRNYDTYKMPRIQEIPEIEVHIMENDERPGGVGEPGLPPFAPALTNAIFDLTGKRIRKLPFNIDAV
ncbi:MAG: xanthine dehydrogenase family protein molybdopterin-binding subunit [Cyclobacteriaceae bacterium]|nr:xanthine dehydrogenase family protein molybdopterin-binding subunit [Cyclobacteriaceae bacterium]